MGKFYFRELALTIILLISGMNLAAQTAQKPTRYNYCSLYDSNKNTTLDYASAMVYAQADSMVVMVVRPWVETTKENYLFTLTMPYNSGVGQIVDGTYATISSHTAVRISKESEQSFNIIFTADSKRNFWINISKKSKIEKENE
ncbi:MAG: hypothetical protein RR485_06525 [Mucinivorans sp.]